MTRTERAMADLATLASVDVFAAGVHPTAWWHAMSMARLLPWQPRDRRMQASRLRSWGRYWRWRTGGQGPVYLPGLRSDIAHVEGWSLRASPLTHRRIFRHRISPDSEVKD